MSAIATTRPRPIDPLAPTVGGRYVDEVVAVERWRGGRPRRQRHTVRTEHFDLLADRGRLSISHGVAPDRIDNDLAGMLADELFGPGWVSGGELFERIMTGVVRTSAPDPLASWELFYRNTLDRLASCWDLPAPAGAGHGTTTAGIVPVYRRALAEVAGSSVLELGACFGFLSVLLAGHGHAVTATDLCPGTTQLLQLVAPRLGVRLTARRADATRVPLRDGVADTVLLVHLLEHLDEPDGTRALAEAQRLARRRVVVAVPYEDEPDALYGHVRAFDAAVLDGIGRASGWAHRVADHHGGWLVLDRPLRSGGPR